MDNYQPIIATHIQSLEQWFAAQQIGPQIATMMEGGSIYR